MDCLDAEVSNMFSYDIGDLYTCWKGANFEQTAGMQLLSFPVVAMGSSSVPDTCYTFEPEAGTQSPTKPPAAQSPVPATDAPTKSPTQSPTEMPVAPTEIPVTQTEMPVSPTEMPVAPTYSRPT